MNMAIAIALKRVAVVVILIFGGPVVLSAAENTKTGVKGLTVFDVSLLDEKPALKSQDPLVTPYEMKRAGIAGTVVVDFILTAEGGVINAFAVKSSRKEFEAAAVQWVQKCKYKPGIKRGRTVATHMIVTVTFSSDKKEPSK